MPSQPWPAVPSSHKRNEKSPRRHTPGTCLIGQRLRLLGSDISFIRVLIDKNVETSSGITVDNQERTKEPGFCDLRGPTPLSPDGSEHSDEWCPPQEGRAARSPGRARLGARLCEGWRSAERG